MLKTNIKFIVATIFSGSLLYLALFWNWAKPRASNSSLRNQKAEIQHINTLMNKGPESRHFPDALVIGVSKCGSTALMYFLTLNPQIITAPGEPEFLSEDINYRRGLDYYHSLLPRVSRGQILIERDGTLWRKQFQERVKETYDKVNPNVKLLLIVCEPVNRVISWYTNSLASGARLPPVEKLIIDQTTGDINENYDGIKAATYDQRFPSWLKLFPRDQIHVVDGDRMKTDPYHELKQVESFIGARSFLRKDHFVYNKTKGFYCRNESKKGVTCMGSHKGRPHPSVDPLVLKRLHRYFEPHNRAFEDMTGQKFDW